MNWTAIVVAAIYTLGAIAIAAIIGLVTITLKWNATEHPDSDADAPAGEESGHQEASPESGLLDATWSTSRSHVGQHTTGQYL